jgi:hypothetical protein
VDLFYSNVWDEYRPSRPNWVPHYGAGEVSFGGGIELPCGTLSSATTFQVCCSGPVRQKQRHNWLNLFVLINRKFAKNKGLGSGFGSPTTLEEDNPSKICYNLSIIGPTNQ